MPALSLMDYRVKGSLFVGLLLLVLVAGCDTADEDDITLIIQDCEELRSQFALGCNGGKDCIPALTNPFLVDAADISYLDDEDRVIGLIVKDVPLAIPHNILWWHEIVNFDFNDLKISATYCPLTGSSLVFDLASTEDIPFGVSGLLFNSNLTMYDRRNGESLWPQMSRGARCGRNSGKELDMYPMVEMTWAGWQALHPDTRVITSSTGFSRDYRQYPYGNYEDEDNAEIFVTMEIDDRRPPKERLLGIPGDDGGIAFPFGALAAEEVAARVVSTSVDGKDVVVFWDAEKQAAAAYRPTVDGQTLTFEVNGDVIVDTQTGSTWAITGEAIDGDLSGKMLESVVEAHTAFWFAWPAFNPNTRIWTGS